MSARATTLAAHGFGPVDALSGSVRAGFLCGASISLFAVACFFRAEALGSAGGRSMTETRALDPDI
jgi:hypothetical protein